jgi:integrase
MDARDPVKIALRQIQEREDEKARQEEQAKLADQITIESALDNWLSGLKPKSRSQRVQLNSIASKLKDWSKEQGLVFLGDIKPHMLYTWHGMWSPKAKNKRDRLSAQTQNLYVSHLHRFFKWAVAAEYLQRDPSTIVKRQKHEHVQTQPLTPEQFQQVMAATRRLEYGTQLRAIFQLQRWTGMRLIDALMMKRNNIKHGFMKIITRKTGARLERQLPKQVLAALAEVKPQDTVKDGHYFWSKECDADNLTIVWAERVRELNEHLSLTDEDGETMDFRSHMLRDTFAVELLLAGVPLEEVSYLLTHTSVKMTEKYYAPWVNRRKQQVQDRLTEALSKMGAAF